MSGNVIFQDTKDKLDSVGCGMCLAKWTQVTMHLHNGMTHSCHHPIPHKIPLEELERDPSALHNTRFKKKKRREMLSGKRPEECNYCWNIEDSSESFSDRTFKSSESWSLPHLEEIKNLRWSDNYNPRYVEVNFSNVCNFKCSYCGPSFSSKWMEEIEKHGPYPTSGKYNELNWLRETGQIPYKHSEHNPYVEAFWKWWPDLYKDLHTFRITGGEPLLSKDTWKILEFIAETKTPNRKLNISINSNMGIPRNLVDKFIEIVSKIIKENRVNEFILFTSCEAVEKQAEYIRNGLDYDLFLENIESVLSRIPKITVNVMATFNAMSVFSYGKLIDKIFELKKKYHNKERYWISAVQLDTSYVRWPNHLSVKILEKEHKDLILSAAKRAFYYATPEFNHKHYGFSNVEIQKIKRLYDYAISEDGFDVEKNRKDFVSFIDEHDKRRDTDFQKTFPEMKKFIRNVRNKKG
jgi:organic radical activating enzyme